MAARLSQADGVFAGCNAVMLLKLRLINLQEALGAEVYDRLKRLSKVQRAQTGWSIADECRPERSGAACAQR